MSTILENNLSYINRYNKNLVEKIISTTGYTKNYELCQMKNGEYNLLINNIPVHDINGAITEAEKIFNALPHNSKNSINVIYGIGMGYVPDKFAENAKGTVIIYEPDIENLRYIFELVDFRDSLNKSNVFLVSDFIEFKIIFELTFRYKTQVSFSYLDFYKNNQETELNAFYKKLENLFSIYSFNYSFQAKENNQFLTSTINSLTKKYKETFIEEYKDNLKNIPAIIVSAGPSLSKNIDKLKSIQNKAVVFCVGTAVKTLYKNEIVPDFLNVIEKINTEAHFDIPCTNEITVISEPFTNESIFNYKFKNRILTASLEHDTNRWFLEKAEKELLPFETKGTVSYQALSAAMYMGCNPIVIIGQDLAYTDGKCYAKGSEFEDLECVKDEKTGKYTVRPKDFEKFKKNFCKSVDYDSYGQDAIVNHRLNQVNNSLILVDSQDGGKLPTESGYAMFIQYLQHFAENYGNNVKLINSSTGGALIKGFETIPIDEVFEKMPKLNKKDLIENLNRKTNIDFNIVLKNIEKDINEIEKVLPLFEKGQQINKKIKFETINKCYTSQKSIELLGKAADLYVNITNNYTNNNRLLKILVMQENYELNYFMKESDGNISDAIMIKFIELFKDYYQNIPEKLTACLNRLKTEVENIKQELQVYK